MIAEGSVWRRGFYERHLVLEVTKRYVRTRELDIHFPLHFRYTTDEFVRWFWQDDGESHCDCATCAAISLELKRPVWRLVGRL